MKDKADIDEIMGILQRCFQRFPTIIIGSGASIDYGLPSMEQLRYSLIEKMCMEGKRWNYLKNSLMKYKNLENALKETKEKHVSQVVNWVWKLVNEKDILKSEKYDEKRYNIGDILVEMFESNRKKIHIITTNYDLLIEYFCSIKGLKFQTDLSQENINNWYRLSNKTSDFDYSYLSRVVYIHKVHGSLDWFLNEESGRMINAPVTNDVPSEFMPLIIPPSKSKYRNAHDDPFRSIIKNADDVIDNSNAFLCFGFGFQDEHIQPKLERICRNRDVPIVVLAKKLTQPTQDFLTRCAGKNYLGIEEFDKSKSFIYTFECPEGREVDTGRLWSMCGFCEMVLDRRGYVDL